MDELSPAEQAEYQALVAESQTTGNQEKLKQFVNDKVSCRNRGEPANFGDGSHYTCPASGGRRRRRKSKSSKKNRKSKKGRKTNRKKSAKRRTRRRRR